MNLLENIRLAVAGLQASKMRALLTMLGIIIGIGSVIAITTVGDSLTGTLTDSMSSLGANNITLSLQEKDATEQHGPRSARQDSVTIDEDDQITTEMIDALMEAMPDELAEVSITENAGTGKARDGRLYANVTVSGTNAGYQTTSNVEVLDGRFLTERDVQGSKNVAVVSDKLATAMYGDADPLEQELRVYTSDQILTYTVVGVYKYQQNAFMDAAADEDVRTSMYIPVTTAKKLAGSGANYSSLTVSTTPGTDAQQTVERIESFFTKYYDENSKYKVSASSMESMLESMTTMLSTVQLAIVAIAAISLLVGGIGVMNIMLVSVTERTREIGTRKALGAKSSAIRIQFVVESIIICLIGGTIGVIVGIGLGSFGSSMLGYPATASVSAITIALLFSMAIGIFFGYYPANKAAKLDPIEALRYE